MYLLHFDFCIFKMGQIKGIPISDAWEKKQLVFFRRTAFKIFPRVEGIT